MDYRKEFIIHYQGLSVGNHIFELEVNDKFFEEFEYSQLQQGHIDVVLNLEKQERMMVLDFRFQGEVRVICDRCGDEFMLPLSGEERLIVKFGEEYSEENAEMIVIPVQEYKFDLAPYIYEYLHLLLPARILHPDDPEGNSTCDPEVIRRLEELTPHPDHDPRWDTLNKLKLPDGDTAGGN